jgi:hypothetical protein
MQMTMRPPWVNSLRISSPATTILGLLVIANSARERGNRAIWSRSGAVLFQDFLELLATSLIVLVLQAVQASRLLAASAELGPSGKLRRLSLECFLAVAPFTVRCISALPWIGQAPTSRSGARLCRVRRGQDKSPENDSISRSVAPRG